MVAFDVVDLDDDVPSSFDFYAVVVVALDDVQTLSEVDVDDYAVAALVCVVVDCCVGVVDVVAVVALDVQTLTEVDVDDYAVAALVCVVVDCCVGVVDAVAVVVVVCIGLLLFVVSVACDNIGKV